MKDEIIIYQLDEATTRLEVRLEDETVWLTQSQIVSLFESSKANISEHIKSIFHTGELIKDETVRKIRTVQMEGNRKVTRNLTFYNLDMIISVGYRVNSIRGTQFRIWASRVLKEYLRKGYVMNQRLENLEKDVFILKEKVNEFDIQLNTHLPPNEGIFYDGQIFDAYLFVNQIIKSAKKSIILIDNYIDETVFSILSKRAKGVNAVIFTSSMESQTSLDLKKHNQQYPEIVVKIYKKSHDRFLIIDHKTVYHIGASIKDLGKKWFAFSKINIDSNELIKNLNSNKE